VAQTPWRVYKMEGKKGGLKEAERWLQAWTPSIFKSLTNNRSMKLNISLGGTA